MSDTERIEDLVSDLANDHGITQEEAIESIRRDLDDLYGKRIIHKPTREERRREIKAVDRETIAVKMRYGLDYLHFIGDQTSGQFVATEGAVGDWVVYMETQASREEGNGFEDIAKYGAKVTQQDGEALFPAWAKAYKWRDSRETHHASDDYQDANAYRAWPFDQGDCGCQRGVIAANWYYPA